MVILGVVVITAVSSVPIIAVELVFTMAERRRHVLVRAVQWLNGRLHVWSFGGGQATADRPREYPALFTAVGSDWALEPLALALSRCNGTLDGLQHNSGCLWCAHPLRGRWRARGNVEQRWEMEIGGAWGFFIVGKASGHGR